MVGVETVRDADDSRGAVDQVAFGIERVGGEQRVEVPREPLGRLRAFDDADEALGEVALLCRREPRVVLDSRFYLLPRGQTPRVGISTINLSALTLKLVRVTERNLVPFGRDWTPCAAIASWDVSIMTGPA